VTRGNYWRHVSDAIELDGGGDDVGHCRCHDLWAVLTFYTYSIMVTGYHMNHDWIVISSLWINVCVSIYSEVALLNANRKLMYIYF
jgi:uncharacterized protein (DUF983 family)